MSFSLFQVALRKHLSLTVLLSSCLFISKSSHTLASSWPLYSSSSSTFLFPPQLLTHMSSLSMLFQVLVPILSPWLASQLLFGQSYSGRPALCKFRCYQCGQTAGTSLLFLNIVAKCVFSRVNPIANGITLRASFQSQSWFPLPCIIKDLSFL